MHTQPTELLVDFVKALKALMLVSASCGINAVNSNQLQLFKIDGLRTLK